MTFNKISILVAANRDGLLLATLRYVYVNFVQYSCSCYKKWICKRKGLKMKYRWNSKDRKNILLPIGFINSEVQLSFLLFPQGKRQFAKKNIFAMVYFYQIRLIFATSHAAPIVFFGNGILLPKSFWPTVGKKISTDREKLLNSRLKAENLQIF